MSKKGDIPDLNKIIRIEIANGIQTTQIQTLGGDIINSNDEYIKEFIIYNGQINITKFDTDNCKEGDRVNIIIHNNNNVNYNDPNNKFNPNNSINYHFINDTYNEEQIKIESGISKYSYIICKRNNNDSWLYQCMALNGLQFSQNIHLNVWIDTNETKKHTDPIKDFIHLSQKQSDTDFKELQRIYLSNCHQKMIKEKFNIDINFIDNEIVYYDCQKNKIYSYNCSHGDFTYHDIKNEYNIKEYIDASLLNYNKFEFYNNYIFPKDYFDNYIDNNAINFNYINELNKKYKIELEKRIIKLKDKKLETFDIFESNLNNMLMYFISVDENNNIENLVYEQCIIREENILNEAKQNINYYYELYLKYYNEKYIELLDKTYNEKYNELYEKEYKICIRYNNDDNDNIHKCWIIDVDNVLFDIWFITKSKIITMLFNDIVKNLK